MSRQTNDQKVPLTPKKTLRRKPPPTLFTEGNDVVRVAGTRTTPSIVSTMDSTSSAGETPATTVTAHSLPPNSGELDDSGLLGEADAMDSASSLSFAGPKPMGPREIPDYFGHNMSQSTPVRQVFDAANVREDSERPSIPYPIHDFFEDERFDMDSSLQTPYRMSSTPANRSHYGIPNRPGSKLYSAYSPIIQENEFPGMESRSPRVSPGSSPSDMRSSPWRDSPPKFEEHPRLRYRRSEDRMNYDRPSESPTRSRTYTPGSPTKRSSWNLSSSRSPSPTKILARSSHFSPGKSYIPEGDILRDEIYDEEDDDDFLYDEYQSPQARSRWSRGSVEFNVTEMDDSQLEYDETETPTANYFDYSVLPDLPSASSAESYENPQAENGKLYLPFIKDQAITPTKQSVSRKRKDEDLPPIPLDLPQLPFSSASLSTSHLCTCSNVWSLRSIFEWCLNLKVWLHDSYINKKEFKKALIKLLVFHRRTVPLDVIGKNMEQIVSTFVRLGAITFLINEDESDSIKSSDLSKQECVIMNEEKEVSGVLVDLTRCYCHDEDHDTEARSPKLRCYSSQCHLNKIIVHEFDMKNKNIDEIVLGEDWASHWKLTAEDLKTIDSSISKRQSLIFDLLRNEQNFIMRAECFVRIVGPMFIKAAKILVGSNEIVSMNKFEDDVLEPGKELIKIHKETLMKPLLRILSSNGKLVKDVVEIAELYNKWTNIVKVPLLKYMTTVPMYENLLKYDVLKRWVEVDVRNNERVKQLKINGHILFFSTFNSRYQTLPLQLSDIRKSFDSREQEYVSLTKAMENLKKLGAKVNKMKIHADNIFALKQIHKQLVWKNNVTHPNINLGSENRRFFCRGDVSKKGDLKINTSTVHLILLDNYLLITEKIKNQRLNSYSFKVVENPIPMEFLMVEEREAGMEFRPIPKTLTSQSSPTQVEQVDADIEPSSYPYKVRYAGRGKHNAYTFSTKTEKERNHWIDFFKKAKSSLCQRMSSSDPYKIDMINNSCFAYEYNDRITKLHICMPYDPIYDIANDAVNKLKALGYVNDVYNFNNSKQHVVFRRVLSCAQFDYKGIKFCLVGTAHGVYCSDTSNRWLKVINGYDVDQIRVESSISVVLLLSSKILRYYSLDQLISVYYGHSKSLTSVSISNDPVLFFVLGRHRELLMLFYAKKKGNSSSATNFKVLVPETDNDGIFSSFRVIKRFYVQADCYDISLFNSTFAVHTNKGIEILELNKLIPRSIPEIPNAEKRIDPYNRRSAPSHPNGTDAIKKLLQSSGVRPMGMFKLDNNSEFLLVYNDSAIFTNKHGKLSRQSMLRFDFKAKSVAFINNHLFSVCEEVIEVWSVSDFVKGTNKLVQVVTGKDIRMIGSSDDLITFSMANPVVRGLQLVFNMKPCDMS